MRDGMTLGDAMKKTITIIASIGAFILVGGLIVVWAVYQKSEAVKTSHLVRDFSDENFESDVVMASTKLPILVDFYAEWCIPCRMLAPIIEEVANDVKDKAIIGRLDTDKNVISRKLGIKQNPCGVDRQGRPGQELVLRCRSQRDDSQGPERTRILSSKREPMFQPLPDLKIIIRGAGEMATGTAVRLHRCGFSRIFMTEIPCPLSVRRLVSFSEAVYEKTWTVEGVRAVRIDSPNEALSLWEEGAIAVFVDPANSARTVLQPDVVVDAILAKKNLDTTIHDASLVVGLGPGFCAGRDVHYVVETNRGHDLGRVISEGEAAADTGVPGEILGEAERRVIRVTSRGTLSLDRGYRKQSDEGPTDRPRRRSVRSRRSERHASRPDQVRHAGNSRP